MCVVNGLNVASGSQETTFSLKPVLKPDISIRQVNFIAIFPLEATMIFLRYKIPLFLVTIFLLSFFCQIPSNSPVIARVGKATLTLHDLNANIPPEYSAEITREQNINYVKQWIDAELFFQEAMRRKLDREDEIKKRLNTMKKDLLAAELMNRTSVTVNTASIDNNAIHAFYERNKENYKREQDLIKYLEIQIADSKIAWYISKNGTTDNILTLAAEYSQNQIPDNLNTVPSVLADLPVEIRNTLLATSIGSVSVPVKTDAGYTVFFVIDKLNQGELCKEEEVREDIYNYLTNNAQKEIVENYLSELRLKTNVEFNTDLITTSFQEQTQSQQ